MILWATLLDQLPCPPPGDLPDPGTQTVSLMPTALAEGSLPIAPPGKPDVYICVDTCVYVHIYVYMCICVCVCVYNLIYIIYRIYIYIFI